MSHFFSLRILIGLLILGQVNNTFAQNNGEVRTSIPLNQNWQFAKDPKKVGAKHLKFTSVDIPHTWNAFDVMDDEPGYYRGLGYYKKKLVLRPNWKHKKIQLYFNGVNQEAEVYLNGKKIGNHIGGYTGFSIPLENLKFNGTDEIMVKVDNSFNESIAPLTADFTFFGGIYRSVLLLVLDQVHFSDANYGSTGVFVQAKNVNEQGAEILVSGSLANTTALAKQIRVKTEVLDAMGKSMGNAESRFVIGSGNTLNFQLPIAKVPFPKLWSPENPYLYKAITSLLDAKTGKILDQIKTPVGLRFFKFDVQKGFFLNGKPYKLMGASRHQDFAGMGNAVPAALQVKDIELLKKMGGNFLRVAHYPQDQAIMDACDQLGIITTVEIPVVNEITETEVFYRNCEHMQLEMIKQNFNHPSVVAWAYMNEVLLKMKFNKEPERKQQYIANITKLAQRLENLTRKTDSTRYTMMANHGDVNGYNAAGLTKIPMLVGWNLYQGWYGGKAEDFGPALDRIHQTIPDKPMLVTEFGADVDPRIHSFNPIRFDKSLEYGMLYHQIYIKDMLKRPFVAGAAVWNLADFSSETRSETMPGINNKGLLTIDRKPKNTYFLYQAYLSANPFVKIGDGNWTWRGGTEISQNLTVISNLDSVALTVNGKYLGKKRVVDHLANWTIDFNNGKNKIEALGRAEGKIWQDTSTINFVLQPQSMQNAKASFNILMGSQRQFIDDENQLWLPSKVYVTNTWGHIGGEPFKIKDSGRQSYGSDKNIVGTTNDPIYQTQLVGVEGYRVSVPKGKYIVTFHFAELMGNGIQTTLPYNLDSMISIRREIPEQRIFEVYLNGKPIIKKLNLAADYGVAKSVKKQFECLVTDDEGIKILFKNIEGKAVLNALQIRKID